MIRLLQACAAIVLLSMGTIAARCSSANLFTDAEAGGGYDSNLNAAPSSSEAKGDGFGFGTASLGTTFEAGHVDAHVDARWSGVAYSRYSDLSSNRIALEGGIRGTPRQSITLRLSPSVAGIFYGDSDRNALGLGLLAGARFDLHPRISIEPTYSLTWRDARSSVFERTAHRFSLALGARPWKPTLARITTTAELGQVVRYLEQPSGGGGGGGSGSGSGGRGRPNDTFGRSLIAVRESATTWETALSLEQGLTDWIFLAVGGGFARVWTDPDDFDVFFMNASLGIRWP